MSVSVSMPQLGESVTEGTVTRWLKKEGERVEADEPLLEVSTDKVDTEIPSPVAGILRGITVAEDETVAVGAELAVIDEEGAAPSAAPAGGSPAAGAEAPAQPAGADSSGGAPADSGQAEQAQQPYQEQGGEQQGGQAQQPYQQAGQAPPAYQPPSYPQQGYQQQPPAYPQQGYQQPPSYQQQPPAYPPQGYQQPGYEQPSYQQPPAQQPEPAQQQAPQQPAVPAQAPPQQQPPAEAAAPPARRLPPRTHRLRTGRDRPSRDRPRTRRAPAAASSRRPRPTAPTSRRWSASSPPSTASTWRRSPAPGSAAGSASRTCWTPPGTDAARAPRLRQPPQRSPPPRLSRGATPAIRTRGPGTGTGTRRTVRPLPAGPAASQQSADSARRRPAIVPSSLRGTTVQMSRARQVIAKRMVESLHVSAQLTTVVEADVTEIARLRERAKAAFESREGVKLSFLPFFALAAVEALKVHPRLNAVIDTESAQVTYHDAEHLGIAVDTDRGLMVPVIRQAGDLNIGGLARKIADLAERTRSGRVSPDDLSGGTFTLTNTGSRGALFDTPIINQPQVAILGTGTVVKRPVVVEDPALGEVITVRSMVYLALTYDHRLVDGADAARFLVTMKSRLEEGAFETELGL